MTEETEATAVPAADQSEAIAQEPRRRRRGGRGRGRSSGAAAARVAEGRKDGAAPETPAEAEAPAAAETAAEGAAEVKSAGQRRRRRRGGRGRGRKPATPVAEGAEVPEVVEPAAEAPEAGGEGAEAKPARGRSRRRKPPAGQAEPAPEGGEPTAEAAGAPPAKRLRSRAKKKPEATERAQKQPAKAEKAAKEPAKRRTRAKEKSAEGEAVAGPTRLRRARVAPGRRRREPAPVIRRVRDKAMVITEHGERDQIAVLENRELVQHYVTRAGVRSMVGNVYLGRVQNVLPGMEAAFVDVGRGRNAVLYAGEVNYSAEDLEGPVPRIEQVLKGGQAVLVQVTKDPMGGKGARLTAQISMPGRYLVLVPDSNVSGISRRLPDDERRRLKAIMKKIRPEGHGIIVRTAAEGADEEALAADVARLVEEWKGIEKRAKRAKAPTLLYEEPELTVRAVRDLFTDEEFRELVTDSTRVYEQVTDYLRAVAPDLVDKVRLLQGKLPAFEEFHIVEQIHKGLDRKVWLPSGGYIIIERTEALTVIDVNTGKHVGKTNLEETVVKTNLEAAQEVARQLRLRDIGGMIIVDFIDMLLEQNKKKVIETLKEAMAQDKTRSQVFDISPLGLLEVTRKRVSGGLLESFSETCPTCEGRGVLLTYEV